MKDHPHDKRSRREVVCFTATSVLGGSQRVKLKDWKHNQKIEVSSIRVSLKEKCQVRFWFCLWSQMSHGEEVCRQPAPGLSPTACFSPTILRWGGRMLCPPHRHPGFAQIWRGADTAGTGWLQILSELPWVGPRVCNGSPDSVSFSTCAACPPPGLPLTNWPLMSACKRTQQVSPRSSWIGSLETRWRFSWTEPEEKCMTARGRFNTRRMRVLYSWLRCSCRVSQMFKLSLRPYSSEGFDAKNGTYSSPYWLLTVLTALVSLWRVAACLSVVFHLEVFLSDILSVNIQTQSIKWHICPNRCDTDLHVFEEKCVYLHVFFQRIKVGEHKLYFCFGSQCSDFTLYTPLWNLAILSFTMNMNDSSI